MSRRDTGETIDYILRKYRKQLTAGLDSLHGETPLEALLRKEGGTGESRLREEEEWAVRDETFMELLDWLWEAGPDPREAVRRLLGITKALRPELLGDMSLEDIARLGGDKGRATVSARIKRDYNGKLEANGMREAKAPFQKSAEAVRTFSEVQKGNKNRSKKKGRRRRRRGGGARNENRSAKK